VLREDELRNAAVRKQGIHLTIAALEAP